MIVQRQLRATDTFIFLLLRRMRAPLIVLIVSFSISILGFVLIPGVDDQGNVWHMDFFHAFYFTSYMATTIGFGELPYPFTELQRFWTIVSIYITVISWLYAFGTIISLLQDSTFRQIVKESGYSRYIRRIRDPFYIICGYGDTGHMLLHSLTERGYQAIVVDNDPQRINALPIENHPVYIPGMSVDAEDSGHLKKAGLMHPMCAGVAAITGDDKANLKIAITVKLLNPSLQVVCRAESQAIADNMNSFGTDYIVTPFRNYASLLSIALHSPVQCQLYNWLYGLSRTVVAEKIAPPSGFWVICGYGRMGKALHQRFTEAGMEVMVINKNAKVAPPGTVAGKGTEAHTLEEANIGRAVGIIAATDDDTDNLSIIMTARDLNPELYIVIRQNSYANEALFKAANVDFIMQNSFMIAREATAYFTAPLLGRFLSQMVRRSNADAELLLKRIQAAVADGEAPSTWGVDMTDVGAAGACSWLRSGKRLSISDLLQEFSHHGEEARLMVLTVVRDGIEHLLPADSFNFSEGDQILFCGQRGHKRHMRFWLSDQVALNYSMQCFEQEQATLKETSA